MLLKKMYTKRTRLIFKILINCTRNCMGKKKKKKRRIKNLLKNLNNPSITSTIRQVLIALKDFPWFLILGILNIFRINIDHVLKDCDFITIDRKKEMGNLKVEKLYRPAAPK